MRPVWLAILSLIGVVISGCIQGPSDGPQAEDGLASGFLSDAAHSHPAFGYVPFRAEVDPESFPSTWIPPAKRALPNTLAALEHVAHATDVPTANGIAIFGHHAFSGSTNGNLRIIDIQDPAKPRVVAEDDTIPVRDADTIAYPDGRLILVSASGAADFYVTDVTDPINPKVIATQATVHTNHNIAVVPGTPIVYNSASGSQATDMYDLTDPENPQLIQDWPNGYACHDISFFIDRETETYRAYCAGRQVTQIWDIADPAAPVVISEIPFPAGGREDSGGGRGPATFSHLAIVNHDASVLIVGDETGGGAAPGCDYYLETPLGTESGPFGNLWFYDLTDETQPVLKGRISPPAIDQRGSCTAHFGHVIEETNHLVMAFYSAGVLLVDFNDLDNPRIVDAYAPTPTSTWDAWYYQGYVFTGDGVRGMDVLTFAGP